MDLGTVALFIFLALVAAYCGIQGIVLAFGTVLMKAARQGWMTWLLGSVAVVLLFLSWWAGSSAWPIGVKLFA